ncbi:DsbA family protein [Spirillospora sp. NBC_01491]|uniref:DsbA family protein n=1 Tax=Spirillospora sp. NBC_01491 TaxID=2976007 RepID=UPI002E362918|nr:thioredoxin domain-containing protein [Spirillospora sp. NBC_01491]
MSGSRRRVLVAAVVAVLVLGVMAVGTFTGRDPEHRSGTASGTASDDPSGDASGDGEEVAPSLDGATPGGPATIPGPTPPPVDQTVRQGVPNAAVTIVEFGDYQCPSCGTFARRTKPELVRRYVDTGVAQFIWRDFPWAGKESTRSAVAARAAGRQGRFWQFHDALYAKQFPERSGHLTDGYLRGIAGRLGLDLARFDTDRRDPALRRAVDEDYGFGQRLGVPGTPAFLIDGTPFFGDQPIKEFVKRIEEARRAR